jgi:hypothetical protein
MQIKRALSERCYCPRAGEAKNLRTASGKTTQKNLKGAPVMDLIKKNTWIVLVAGFAVLIAVGVLTT